MKFFALIALTLSLFPFTTVQAQENVKIVPIKDNLHMLISPQGGNITVSSGSDGTFIIDDNLQGRAQTITDAIKTFSNKEVKFVLNTHYHFDHTGENEFFGENGAILIAHDNVRKRLASDQFITYFKKNMPALSKAGLPVVTFSNDMGLHYNDDTIQITHLPNAHTDGDALAQFTNKNVIVAGDVIFNGIYPFIDTEHGGTIKGLIGAHDTILSLANDDTIIIPGHGDFMSKTDLIAYRSALFTIMENIEALIANGKTLEETITAKPTSEFDAKLGNGFIPPKDFITTLYNDLNR